MIDAAKPLPAADAHAPVSLLNRTGRGVRTITACSCGWQPRKASERGSTSGNAHMAHRRKLGMSRADYSAEVFGEGPWSGWTWNDWQAQHGGQNIDPYTGQKR